MLRSGVVVTRAGFYESGKSDYDRFATQHYVLNPGGTTCKPKPLPPPTAPVIKEIEPHSVNYAHIFSNKSKTLARTIPEYQTQLVKAGIPLRDIKDGDFGNMLPTIAEVEEVYEDVEIASSMDTLVDDTVVVNEEITSSMDTVVNKLSEIDDEEEEEEEEDLEIRMVQSPEEATVQEMNDATYDMIAKKLRDLLQSSEGYSSLSSVSSGWFSSSGYLSSISSSLKSDSWELMTAVGEDLRDNFKQAVKDGSKNYFASDDFKQAIEAKATTILKGIANRDIGTVIDSLGDVKSLTDNFRNSLSDLKNTVAANYKKRRTV